MNELKSVYIDRTGDWVRSGNDTGKFYLKEEVDAVIADIQKTNVILSDNAVKLNRELDKLKKRSSCTFSDDCLRVRYLKRENEQLKAKLEDAKATAYAESVDAGMENRRLKRALWLARANRAKEHVWHDVKTDGSPLDDYKGHDWVLVKYQENGGFHLIPRIAEYRKNLKRWVLIDEDDITPHHDYLLKYCRVIGWRDIDFVYYGRKFFVQQEINKKVERKCRAKAEEYK